MTLILKCGGVVYRVNVAGHDFILCHVIYICIYMCVCVCRITGQAL